MPIEKLSKKTYLVICEWLDELIKKNSEKHNEFLDKNKPWGVENPKHLEILKKSQGEGNDIMNLKKLFQKVWNREANNESVWDNSLMNNEEKIEGLVKDIINPKKDLLDSIIEFCENNEGAD